jgi:hypothetical protein
MPNDSYQAQVTTPAEDKILDDLREGLRTWLLDASNRGVDHSLAITALMLFVASGVAATDIPREAYLDLAGRYYDMYRKTLKAQS